MQSRVAILTGGGDRPYALGLAASLIAAAVPFDFIGSDDLESPELRAHPGVRVFNLRGDMRPDVPLPRKVARLATYYARLLAYAVRAEPNIFHLLWNNKVEWFDRTLLMLFYRLLGKRVVLTVHNVNIRERDGRDTAWNRATLWFQYRVADHLFVHTQKMGLALQVQFGVPAGKVSVIPFGINSTVPDTALTSTQARTRLGLGSHEKVLLFFGNIAPYKGVQHLVEAAAALKAAEPDLRVVIAGRPKEDPEYWASIEQRIEALGLGARFLRHIVYVPDADTEVYFKAADLLVLPYTHVFQSGVLFLGYNFGLPVVVTEVGSLADDVVPGQTGYVCRPGDAADLARAIAAYLESDLYRTLAARRADIRRFAAERYSWAIVAEITDAVYRRVCGR